MKLSDFNYYLPKDQIAQTPLEPRDSSKLMVIKEGITHLHFYDIINYFENGDTLVLNNSKVIPAKLKGKKISGGNIEALIISKNSNGYECFLKGKNIKKGTKLYFENLEAEVTDIIKIDEIPRYCIQFNSSENLNYILEKIGEAPLPPYIKKKLDDKDRYQTIYSKENGSIAAPTAGLHFTKELLEKILSRGVNIAYITLHVSLGTFTQVKTENIESHKMEPEYFSIDTENARIINETKGKIIVCGTTTAKALESSCNDGKIIAKSGESNIFIYPPYKFKTRIDALITNFHLPSSTLIMLVSAYGGKERIMKAYEEAILNSYRFYSFGDAMLIFK